MAPRSESMGKWIFSQLIAVISSSCPGIPFDRVAVILKRQNELEQTVGTIVFPSSLAVVTLLLISPVRLCLILSSAMDPLIKSQNRLCSSSDSLYNNSSTNPSQKNRPWPSVAMSLDEVIGRVAQFLSPRATQNERAAKSPKRGGGAALR